MSNNKVSIQVIDKLIEALQINTTLLKLDISNCDVVSYHDTVIVFNGVQKIALYKSLTCQLTRSLLLFRKNIGNAGADIFSNILHDLTQITELDLSYCNISDDGVAAISEWLRTNYCLKILNLSHNRLTIRGACKIAEVFPVRRVLKKLDISYCCITRDEVKIIRDAFVLLRELLI